MLGVHRFRLAVTGRRLKTTTICYHVRRNIFDMGFIKPGGNHGDPDGIFHVFLNDRPKDDLGFG